MSVSEGLLRTYEPAHVVDLVEGLAAMGYKPREQITYAIMAVVRSVFGFCRGSGI